MRQRAARLRNRPGRALRRAGGATIDATYALMFFGLLSAPLAWQIHESAQDRIDSVAAGQLARVTEAAEGYVKANLPTLPGQLSGRRYLDIPFDTLKNSGFLSDAWTGVTPYGQTYRIVLTQPDPGRKAYEVVVLTRPQPGAPPIEPTHAPVLAAQAGERGGYVNEANVLTGAGGGWQVADTRARWGLDAPKGTVGSVTPIGEGEVTSTYLNRNNTGDPEANRMHAPLDMNGNNIDQAGKIDAQTARIQGDLTAGRVQADDLKSNGGITAASDIVAGHDVRAGNDVIAGHDATARNNLVAGNDVSAGHWLMAQQIQPKEIVTLGAYCQTGNVARLGDGATASCVDSQWVKLGDGKSCGAYGGVNKHGKVSSALHGAVHSFNSRNKNDDYYLAQCWDGVWSTHFVGRG